MNYPLLDMTDSKSLLYGLTMLDKPLQKCLRGKSYNIVASRYVGWGIHHLLCVDDGRAIFVVWQDYGGEHDIVKEFQLNVVASEWENFNGESVPAAGGSHTQSSIVYDEGSTRDT